MCIGQSSGRKQNKTKQNKQISLRPLFFPFSFVDDQQTTHGATTKNRVMILLLGLIAIAFSVLTILSCSFFEHRNNINNGLPASNTEMTATLTPQEEGGAIFGVDVSGIGLFSFELNSDETNFSIVDTETETDTAIGLGFDEIEFDDLTGETCQPYEGRFISPAPWMDTVWIVAQFASIIAPCLGGVAFLFIFLETTIGPFRGSFLAPILLLITSSFVQGCTFLTLAQKDVCFANDDINTSSGSNGSTFVGTGLSPSSSSYCRLSYGAFMSISASFIYYLVSVGLCCFPRPKSSLCCCFTKSSSSRTIISGDGKNDPRRRPQSSSSSSSSDHNRHSEEVVDTTDEEDPTPPPRCRSSSSNDNSGNRNEEDDEVADRRGEIGANQHQRRYIWQELY